MLNVNCRRPVPAGLCFLYVFILIACGTNTDSPEDLAEDQEDTSDTSSSTPNTDPTDNGSDETDHSSDPICDLLMPIATDEPNEQLFPPVAHPRSPLRAATLSGPVPTNHFVGNLLVDPGSDATYVHPYVVKLNNHWPYGLSISHSDHKISGGSGSNGAVQYYFNVFERDLGFSMAESIDDQQIKSIGEFGFSLELSSNNTGSVTFPVVRGMAYVTAQYTASTPIVFTQHAIVSINNTSPSNQSHTGNRFELELNNGDRWVVYVLGTAPLTFTADTQTMTANDNFEGALRIAKLPTHTDDARALLDSHKDAVVTGAVLSAAMHATRDNAASYSFTWQTAGSDIPLLHYALPHHQEIIAASAQQTDLELPSTTKGMMRAYIGNRWTLREPTLSNITWLPPLKPSGEDWTLIETQLRNELEQDFNVGQDSYYFAGKGLYKRALLCLIADDANMLNERDQCVSKLSNAIAPFISGNVQHPLRRDTTWGGVVSSAGIYGDAMHDFGNSYYNDHHYHWGYYLQTAAILAKLDPSWGEANREWVETLIRDVSNPSNQDPYFPVFRSFDWYSGHSWSQGIFPSADGKDEESTSEEIHFHYGLKLWGLATDNQRLANLGNLMVAMASRSINTYFLLRDDNTVHPPEFIGNRVTGIFFENKADYATWFGSNREYIHGIQMLPVTAMTEHVRFSDFVEQEWSILDGLASGLSSGWKSVLYTNYAIINPHDAFQVLQSAPLDDGLTRTWALYWASTRPQPHTVERCAPPISDDGYTDWLAVACE